MKRRLYASVGADAARGILIPPPSPRTASSSASLSPFSGTATASSGAAPEGDVTFLTLTASGSSNQPYMATIFPHEGQVPFGYGIVSVDDPNLRSSVLSRWPDNSASVVVVAGQRNVVNGTVQVKLQAGNGGGTDLTPAFIDASLTSIGVNFGALGSATITDFTTPDFIWWQNPAVICARYRIDLGSGFTIVFDIHAFAGGKVFVEAVVENGTLNANAATVVHPTTKTYTSATLSVNGSTFATVSSPTNGMSSPNSRPGETIQYAGGHEPSRAWYASTWVGGDPAVDITHDPLHMQQHPWFWVPVVPSNRNFTTYYAQTYDTYVPWACCRLRAREMSAGSDDESIAMYPDQDCDYFQSGNRFARRAAIATGLAHLSLNFQWRHTDGRVPLRSQLTGKSTSDGGAGNWPIITTAPRMGGGTFDGSHIPATTLVPFLCRPSPCFIELAQKEFAWIHTNYGSEDGWHEYDQVRSRAWRNRNYAIATWLTPDADSTRKSQYRTVLGINSTQILRFFQPWNTLGAMWKEQPDQIVRDENGGSPWPIGTPIETSGYMMIFCAWVADAITRTKIVSGQALTDWNTICTNLLRFFIRSITEADAYSAPGVWRMSDIDDYIGNIASQNPDTLTQPTNAASLRVFGKTGTAPTARDGIWLNGEPQAGGSDNWGSMGEDAATGYTYSAQRMSAIAIALERGTQDAAIAWQRIHNGGITNFHSSWKFTMQTTPRFNRFPKQNSTSLLARTARAQNANTFAPFAGGGLTATTVHPTLGTTPPLMFDGRSNATYQVLGYCGKGNYDSIGRRVLWMGCGASNGFMQNDESGAYQVNHRPIYDEDVNLWRVERAFRDPSENTTARAIGHQYDGNCIDVVGRRMFKCRFNNTNLNIYVYDLDTGQMLQSIPYPGTVSQFQCWHGLEFIPNRGSEGSLWMVGWASSQLTCWEYNLEQYPGGSTWSVIITPSTFGGNTGVGNGPTISYNPRANSGAGGVMIGNQNGCWTVTTPNSGAVAVTPRSLPGGNSIEVAVSGFCRDPLGPGFLKFTSNNVYRWDGSAWSLRSPSGAPSLWDFMVIPIDDYGVVWCINRDSDDDITAFLYKSG